LAVEQRSVVIPTNPFLLSEAHVHKRVLENVHKLLGNGLSSAGASMMIAIVIDYMAELTTWIEEGRSQ
jgi:hypothetical protein